MIQSWRPECTASIADWMTGSGTGVVFPAERYERIQERLSWFTYQRVLFGLHVHVGIPSGDMVMGVIGMLVQYQPHLLAVSANSPFWHGVDTGLSSTRVALYRLLPHAGVPRHFRDWEEFRSSCPKWCCSTSVCQS